MKKKKLTKNQIRMLRHAKAYKIYKYIEQNLCSHEAVASKFGMTRQAVERLIKHLSQEKQEDLKEISYQLQRQAGKKAYYWSKYY